MDTYSWEDVKKGFSKLDPTNIGKAKKVDQTATTEAQETLTDNKGFLTELYQSRPTQAPQVQMQNPINRKSIGDVREVDMGQSPTAQFVNFQGINPQAIEMQRQAAMGLAPSQATGLLQQGISEAGKLGMALAGARGGYSPAAVRGAQREMSAATQNAAAQAAQIRATEMAQARQAFGDISMGEAELGAKRAALQQEVNIYNATEQGRFAIAQADMNLRAQMANQGIDLEVIKANAVRGDQYALANLQAQLTQIGMNDAMQIAYVSQLLGIDSTILTAEMQRAALEQSRLNANAANNQKMISSTIGAGGQVIAGQVTRPQSSPGGGAPQSTVRLPSGEIVYEGGPSEDIPMESGQIGRSPTSYGLNLLQNGRY